MFLFDTNLIKTNGIGKKNFLIFAFFEILRKSGFHSLERLRRHGAVAEQARRAERERAAERRALFFSLGDVKTLAAGEKVRSEKNKIEIGRNKKVGTELAIFYAAKP